MSALSVEPRGVAALPDGFPEDVSHGSNVREGSCAGASRPTGDGDGEMEKEKEKA